MTIPGDDGIRFAVNLYLNESSHRHQNQHMTKSKFHPKHLLNSVNFFIGHLRWGWRWGWGNWGGDGDGDGDGGGDGDGTEFGKSITLMKSANVGATDGMIALIRIR